MQTWLDALVQARSDAFAAGHLPAKLPGGLPEDFRTAAERIQRDMRASKGRLLEAARCWTLLEIVLSSRPGLSRMERHSSALNGHLAPFLFDFPAARATYTPDDGGTVEGEIGAGYTHPLSGTTLPMLDPVALRLDKDLVADLSHARAPSSPEIEREIRQHAWYLDIPHRALLIEQMEVRAIIATSQAVDATADAEEVVTAMAIFTEPGRDNPFSVLSWTLVGPDALFTAAPDGFNHETAKAQMSDFFRLVVAYRMTRRGEAEKMVPHTKPEALAADRNWKARSKTTSLFRVADLKAPPDRFGRSTPRQAGEASWRLGWRSTVSPHFRWQPHGPRSSLRKLIWVEVHERGPRDAPRKAEIEALR